MRMKMNTSIFVSVLTHKSVFFTIFGIISLLARSEKINPKGCGVSKPIARIIDGQVATKKEIPWIVSVIRNFPKNDQLCGGSIISPSFVLTAAHCLYNDNTTQKTSKVTVHYNSTEMRSGVTRLVVDYIYHPKYVKGDKKTVPFDIAILKLDRPLVFDDFVKPICLPRRKFGITGTTFLTAGWGFTETGEVSTVLLRATVKGIPYWSCERLFPSLKAKVICALRGSGQLCHGDSGGPMTIRQKDGISLLLGIISSAGPCSDPGTLLVGVRVSGYIPWIEKQMKRLKSPLEKTTTVKQPVEKTTTQKPVDSITTTEPPDYIVYHV